MVIGLRKGRNTNLQDKEKAFLLARKFCEKFEERFAEERIKENKCVNFVKETVSFLMKLIEA